jgi:hypothetical protein
LLRKDWPYSIQVLAKHALLSQVIAGVLTPGPGENVKSRVSEVEALLAHIDHAIADMPEAYATLNYNISRSVRDASAAMAGEPSTLRAFFRGFEAKLTAGLPGPSKDLLSAEITWSPMPLLESLSSNHDSAHLARFLEGYLDRFFSRKRVEWDHTFHERYDVQFQSILRNAAGQFGSKNLVVPSSSAGK